MLLCDSPSVSDGRYNKVLKLTGIFPKFRLLFNFLKKLYLKQHKRIFMLNNINELSRVTRMIESLNI